MGILRHSTEVEKQLDAVEFREVYDTDSDGNPVLMIEEVPLEVPNYRTHEEITEEGKVKRVNGTINCTAIHNLKKDRRYAIVHTAKEAVKKEEEIANLKGKVGRIKKKARAAYEKRIGKLLRKNKQLEVVKEKAAAAVREETREKHEAAENKREGEIAEVEQTIEREQREAGEKIAVCREAIEMNFYTAYKCIYQQQARVKPVGNTLHVIYIKVPGKWRDDMRKAFERINARGITTPEGWRIHLEI